jgi:hypothetical protein
MAEALLFETCSGVLICGSREVGRSWRRINCGFGKLGVLDLGYFGLLSLLSDLV